MTAVGVLALLVYTFGAFACGGLLYLSIREFGLRGWAGQPRPRARPTQADLAGGAMLTLGFTWFVTNAVAIVGLEASCETGRLLVTVTDNGPGFTARARTTVDDRPRAGGYGLANIRRRLEGYFGADGALTIARDEKRGRTRVSVSMPAGGPA